MPDLVYLIGGPGTGKSTIMDELTRQDGWLDRAKPFAHRTRGPVVVLGKKRDAFGGTDTLGMSVARTAEAWVAKTPAGFVLGEGDRLSYARFFHVAASAGYRLLIFHLVTPAGVAARRRAERAERQQVRQQDPTWVKGRVSKAAALAARLGAARLDGREEPAVNAAAILSLATELEEELRRPVVNNPWRA